MKEPLAWHIAVTDCHRALTLDAFFGLFCGETGTEMWMIIMTGIWKNRIRIDHSERGMKTLSLCLFCPKEENGWNGLQATLGWESPFQESSFKNDCTKNVSLEAIPIEQINVITHTTEVECETDQQKTTNSPLFFKNKRARFSRTLTSFARSVTVPYEVPK